MKKILVLLSLVFAVIVTGCAKPQIVRIFPQEDLSRVAIEEIINDKDLTSEEKATLVQMKMSEEIERKKRAVEMEKDNKLSNIINRPVTPLRTPDTILRVLILPYEDNNGVLNGWKYSYVKVDDGKWIMADYLNGSISSTNMTLTPLKTNSSENIGSTGMAPVISDGDIKYTVKAVEEDTKEELKQLKAEKKAAEKARTKAEKERKKAEREKAKQEKIEKKQLEKELKENASKSDKDNEKTENKPVANKAVDKESGDKSTDVDNKDTEDADKVEVIKDNKINKKEIKSVEAVTGSNNDTNKDAAPVDEKKTESADSVTVPAAKQPVEPDKKNETKLNEVKELTPAEKALVEEDIKKQANKHHKQDNDDKDDESVAKEISETVKDKAVLKDMTKDVDKSFSINNKDTVNTDTVSEKSEDTEEDKEVEKVEDVEEIEQLEETEILKEIPETEIFEEKSEVEAVDELEVTSNTDEEIVDSVDSAIIETATDTDSSINSLDNEIEVEQEQETVNDKVSEIEKTNKNSDVLNKVEQDVDNERVDENKSIKDTGVKQESKVDTLSEPDSNNTFHRLREDDRPRLFEIN